MPILACLSYAATALRSFGGAKEFVGKAFGNNPFFRPLPKGAGASLRTYEAALIKLRFIIFLLIIYFPFGPFSFVIL